MPKGINKQMPRQTCLLETPTTKERLRHPDEYRIQYRNTLVPYGDYKPSDKALQHAIGIAKTNHSPM